MRHKYALVVIGAVLATVWVLPTGVHAAPNTEILQAVGESSGATCDVSKAYTYLQSKTSGNGWKVTPNVRDGNKGLDPEFACRLARFFSATGCGTIFSAVRDRSDTLRACGTLNGRSGCNAYGNSCHNYGLAVDVSGCYQYKNVMSRYGLHFPYNQTHIQCVEHARPQCSTQTRTCSGRPASVSIDDVIGQGGSNVGSGGRGSDEGRQDSILESFLKKIGLSSQNLSGQDSTGSLSAGAGQQTSGDYGKGGGVADIRTPISKPQSIDPAVQNKPVQKSESKQWGAARISCTQSSLNKIRILWRCDSPSTNSRGGTTSRRSGFNTKGKLSGGGYATFTESTGYRVQCLNNGKVVGEATCRVEK